MYFSCRYIATNSCFSPIIPVKVLHTCFTGCKTCACFIIAHVLLLHMFYYCTCFIATQHALYYDICSWMKLDSMYFWKNANSLPLITIFCFYCWLRTSLLLMLWWYYIKCKPLLKLIDLILPLALIQHFVWNFKCYVFG